MFLSLQYNAGSTLLTLTFYSKEDTTLNSTTLSFSLSLSTSEAMKNLNFQVLLIFVFFLLSYTTSARLLQTNQEEQKVNAMEFSHGGGQLNVEIKEEDFSNLMGLEKCEDDKDEECMKRRMIADAHLDYIYTQHQHP